jgi:hypothetical protein
VDGIDIRHQFHPLIHFPVHENNGTTSRDD